MLRGWNVSQIDGGDLNDALALPVIRHASVRGKMSQVESWGVEKETAVAILHAFTSEKPEPDAVHLVNMLKKALEHRA